ncbi:MAG TPA: alpha/beta hydrolase [Microvirga sp.]|nr:alpha/beta hydrolase [Microvirga sp.]
MTLAVGGASLVASVVSSLLSPKLAMAQGNEEALSTSIEFVEINGARLAYERHGRPGRPALVFVHGYGLRGTGALYAPLIAKLATEFDVYALDLRGHGASASARQNWSQTTIADDVAAFVQHMGLKGAIYVGHSLGGFTGMLAQIRHPGTFAGLCLLATVAASGTTQPPELKQTLVTKGRDIDLMTGTYASMFVRPDPATIRRSAEAVALVSPEVHETFFTDLPNYVITDRLAEIRIPVLLLNGAQDNVISVADQQRTARSLPSGTDVTLAQEGHMLPLEAADITAREIMTFYRQAIQNAG